MNALEWFKTQITCAEAIRWLKYAPEGMTLAEASDMVGLADWPTGATLADVWASCNLPGLMLWMLRRHKLCDDSFQLHLFAYYVAEDYLRWAKSDYVFRRREDYIKCQHALETKWRWLVGDATGFELCSARRTIERMRQYDAVFAATEFNGFMRRFTQRKC